MLTQVFAPRRRTRVAGCALLLFVWAASSANAQNFTFDARRIGLGGAGASQNPAAKLVEKQRRYSAIVIPIGLVKAIRDIRVFYPNVRDLDLSRAVEYASSPIHTVFWRHNAGRDSAGGDDGGGSFFSDVIHARLNPDLNAYRGFAVSPSVIEEGLAAPTWGKTFMLRKDDRGYHGIYVGAGPYIAFRADAQFDLELVNLLSGPQASYPRSAELGLGGGERNQLALNVTGGYHARLPLPGLDGPRDGMYIAANYHYLHGFRFDDIHGQLRLDTDSAGLVAGAPPAPPLAVTWDTSSSGRGLSLDFGAAFVLGRWEFGTGVNGVANRIDWRRIERHEVFLTSLFDSSSFVHDKLPVTDDVRRVELPVTVASHLAYHRDKWSLMAEHAHGFEGENYLAGLEYRIGVVELRGAGRLSQGTFHPSAGAGYNLTRRFGVDVAFYDTATLFDRRRSLAMAVSFRLQSK